MIDFSTLKAITIPEGVVTQIEVGDNVIWKKNPLPSGYQALEYIQGTGTQYINTDFIPDQDTRVVVDIALAQKVTAQGIPFGTRNAPNGTDPHCFVFSFFSTWVRSDYYGSSITIEQSYDVGTRITIDHDKNRCTINGTTIEHENKTMRSLFPLQLFNSNSNYELLRPFLGKMYSCKIYDNGTLVRDYVPCINADGEVGMYDTVNGAFYGNVSSAGGAFIAGE